ncbi:hypothetical protein CK203_065913 [Vitis vinifera]|uniref:Uncharacterized protein n=1 Tax=Vitis vinifera TaxID=29760 RepID=A0A438FNY7_VITVI|nr:hypothetical protein CK203_065913 [Vitis vinifera]
MIMRSLQLRFARHLMGFPHTDFWILGKSPSGGQRLGDVGAIKPPTPSKPMTPTYLHPDSQPVFAAHVAERPPAPYTRPRASTYHYLCAEATTSVCSVGYAFESSFSEATQRGPGHDTDHCNALRHANSGFDRPGFGQLGAAKWDHQPSSCSFYTRSASIFRRYSHMDLIEDDSIHMLSWDDGLPEPIVLHDIYEVDGVSVVPQTPALFKDDDSAGREIQIVTRSGRIAQPPPPAVRPFEGTASHEEVRREDDEVLRQLQSTQARISIWSLLASSSTHRDALIRALSQIRVETTTTPEGLIHMMTASRATCIVFSDDDLPPDGLDHVRPLYITVGCSGRRVPSVLLDNGSALNVCPLATAIALGFAPSDFGPSTQTVRAYDSTKREVMGTLMIDLQIGPATFSTLFQVLRIPTSFNLLLGRPWIHVAGAIPSSLHQKVKFIHDGQVITVQSTRDMLASSEPVLQISHSEDDLFLTGFTFDEIQTLEIEDFHRDFVAMSFDQHSSTVILDMMSS